MASTATTFSFALKERYATAVEDMIGKGRPFLGMAKRNPDIDGELFAVPIIHGRPQGLAAGSRATAQGTASNVVGKQFQVTTGDYYASVYIGRKVLLASRKNMAAFLDNKSAEIDGLYEQVMDVLANAAWGNGGGAIGQIGSISSDTITLKDPSSVINFEEGMEICASEGDGSDGAHTLQAGTTTVDVVNRAEGKIDITASELTSEDADDYLFRYGDFNGNTGAVIMYGLQRQLAGSATPATLYGVTRTSDPSRLAGCWVPSADLTGLNMEQRIKKLGTYMSGRFRVPTMPDVGFMHPENWETLEQILSARGTRSLTDDTTRFGYQYLEVVTGGVRQKIYQDPYCPKGTYFALNMKGWTMGSLTELVHPVSEDGITILRGSTTDNFEYRLASFPALYTSSPVNNGRVALT